MQKLQLDADTWVTLNRLLDEALDQPPEEIETWLRNLPADVATLQPRLRRMLERTGAIETHDFLHTLPKLDLTPGELADSPTSEQPGQQVGPYRLLRELGSGGMGVVWLAERIDGLINRPVALKLPHGAWKRAGLAERMAREREILATLAHPNIAHLYDAGVTPAGQPYLAIEFVEGVRIDLFCRDQRLDTRARLHLFSQVASAVAYAHGKLVVHRDLKPANVLVSAQGQARLLDFGIAKLIEEGTAKESRVTELSGRALTPDYASPEQIRGEPITIASDVYSLGVVLYELLSGERPYKLRRDSRGALEEAILQAEPAPPSEMIAAPARKELRGDLDTVVLKALRKDPAQRYPTAHALLDDIERFLTSRPVLAQPDSRWYRARKFVARNRLAVGSAAGISLALLTGAGVAAWQARVALAQKERAEEVQEFITSVFREADPTQGKGKSLSAAELVLQAERRLHERADASPELRAQLLAIMGESLFGLQDLKESARVLEEALRVQATAAPDSELTARLHLALSQAYEYLGRNDDAKAQLTRSFALLKQDELSRTPLFVRAKLHETALGLVFSDFERTIRVGGEAQRAAASIFGPRSAEVATAMQLVSKAYVFTDRKAEAVPLSKQALELMLANYNGDYSHPKVIESAQYYANALVHTGDLDTAAAIMQDVTARAKQVLGDESRMVGELLAMGVPAELERGNLRVAVEQARQSVAIYLRDSAPGTDVHAYRARLLGHSQLASRAGAKAVEDANEAVRVTAAAAATAGVDPRASGRATLGLALAQEGRFAESQAQLDIALKDLLPGSRGMHQAMRHQGTLLRLQGRAADSLPWFDKAIAAASDEAFDRQDRAIAFSESGLVRLELGELDAAEAAFAQSEELFARIQKEFTTPAHTDLLLGIGRAKMARKQFANALPPLQQADAFWREFAPDSRWAGEAALWLGRCLHSLGREREAREALDRAGPLLAASPFPTDGELMKLARRR